MGQRAHEFLERTSLRFCAVGFVLLLLLVLSMTVNLPAGEAGRGELSTAVTTQTPELLPTEVPMTEIPTEPTNTPFPPEFYENYKQTSGVIIVGSLLVLIIVGGVFFQMLADRKKGD